VRETALQTPRSVKQGGKEVLQAPEQRFPCSAWRRPWCVGCPPADHGGPRWSRYPPAARGGTHVRSGGCPEEAVTLWKARTGAGSWQDLWTHRERSPFWSRSSVRTCDPTGDPHWSNLFLNLWEGLTLEHFMKNCVLWEGPHAGAGEECEEEGAAEITRYELTTTSFHHPHLQLLGWDHCMFQAQLLGRLE